ncbi:ABC transporter substrate-binding protein [bacterium]|nr:MAG: ABC transporter substrate-binding protein [bacterium]
MSDVPMSRGVLVKRLGTGVAALAVGLPAFIPRRGSAADTVKIGQIEELTGTLAAQAQSEVQGAQLAMESWNARGGVMSRRIEVVVEDNLNNPGVSVEKARKLINIDKCTALIGTTNSGATLSTSAAASTMNVMFIGNGHAVETAPRN